MTSNATLECKPSPIDILMIFERYSYHIVIISNAGWLLAPFIYLFLAFSSLSSFSVSFFSITLFASGVLDLTGFTLLGLSLLTKSRFLTGDERKTLSYRSMIIFCWVAVTATWRIMALFTLLTIPVLNYTLPPGLSIVVSFFATTTIIPNLSKIGLLSTGIFNVPTIPLLTIAALVIVSSLLLSYIFLGFSKLIESKPVIVAETPVFKSIDKMSKFYCYLNLFAIMILPVIGALSETLTPVTLLFFIPLKVIVLPCLGIVVMVRAIKRCDFYENEFPGHVKDFKERLEEWLIGIVSQVKLLLGFLLLLLVIVILVCIYPLRPIDTNFPELVMIVVLLIILAPLTWRMTASFLMKMKFRINRSKIVSISFDVALVFTIMLLLVLTPFMLEYEYYGKPDVTISYNRQYGSDEALQKLRALEIMDISSFFSSIPVTHYGNDDYITNGTFEFFTAKIENPRASKYVLEYYSNVSFHQNTLNSNNLALYCKSVFTSYSTLEKEGWWNGTSYTGFIERDYTEIFDIIDTFSWNNCWVIASNLKFETVTNAFSATWLVMYQIAVLTADNDLLYIATGSYLAVT
ncbi:MAG: hypothetical protein ACTSP4_16415 [Candidatus Hodarchaeales archaeon]